MKSHTRVRKQQRLRRHSSSESRADPLSSFIPQVNSGGGGRPDRDTLLGAAPDPHVQLILHRKQVRATRVDPLALRAEQDGDENRRRSRPLNPSGSDHQEHENSRQQQPARPIQRRDCWTARCRRLCFKAMPVPHAEGVHEYTGKRDESRFMGRTDNERTSSGRAGCWPALRFPWLSLRDVGELLVHVRRSVRLLRRVAR
jgi:hypothetical protein